MHTHDRARLSILWGWLRLIHDFRTFTDASNSDTHPQGVPSRGRSWVNYPRACNEHARALLAAVSPILDTYLCPQISLVRGSLALHEKPH